MNKLTVTQWIVLIGAVLGMIMETGVLGDSVLVSEIISKILIVLGIVKFAYDQYISFQAQDVANFANEQKVSGAESRKAYVSKSDVRDWASR